MRPRTSLALPLALALALLLSRAPGALGGLLYALVDSAQEDVPSYVALISPPNATLRQTAAISPPRNLFAAENLFALGSGRAAYILFGNLSTQVMDVLAFDLVSGAQLSQVPTPLPLMGIEGLQQEMAFIPATGEVVLLGAISTEADAPFFVMAVDPSTGAVRHITKKGISPKQYQGFLGNFAGFSPPSNRFWFQLRNSSNEQVMVSFHVDVTTGEIATVNGCFFNSAAYDAARDEFVGFAVFRNGTNITDVYEAIARVPANATQDCKIGAKIFDEGRGQLATIAGELLAFDAELRLVYTYALRQDLMTYSLIEVNSETGKLQVLEPPLESVADLPAFIAVSALCGERGGEGAC